MSLGFCGKAVLAAEDDRMAIYRYSGENWNALDESRGNIQMLDGELFIQKSSLVEPEIHIRIRKTLSHRRILTEKRIHQAVNVSGLIKSGYIEIKPSAVEQSMQSADGEARMYFAIQLLRKIFASYQEKGKLPDSCVFVV